MRVRMGGCREGGGNNGGELCIASDSVRRIASDSGSRTTSSVIFWRGALKSSSSWIAFDSRSSCSAVIYKTRIRGAGSQGESQE
jgi:hypothetical protein